MDLSRTYIDLFFFQLYFINKKNMSFYELNRKIKETETRCQIWRYCNAKSFPRDIKYLRKYIFSSHAPPPLHIVLIRLYLLGVYLTALHTLSWKELQEIERSRISFLACRSDLARRKTPFRIPGVLTYARAPLRDTRLNGIRSLARDGSTSRRFIRAREACAQFCIKRDRAQREFEVKHTWSSDNSLNLYFREAARVMEWRQAWNWQFDVIATSIQVNQASSKQYDHLHRTVRATA